MAGGLRVWCNQTRVLGQKNLIIFRRNWRATLGILFAPVVISLLLLGFQAVSNYVLNATIPNPPIDNIGPIPRCIAREGIPCVTIRYCPAGVAWVETLLMEVASRNGLNFSTDFSSPCEAFSTPEADNATLVNYFADNQNATLAGLMFQSAYAFNPPVGLPPAVGYTLFYNGTANYSYAYEVKRAVDEVILQFRGRAATGNDALMGNLTVNAQNLPQAKLRIAGYDVVAANGGIWFYVPPMIIFFIVYVNVVEEKEMRLRLGMRMMGLRSSVYWFIWFLTGVVFVTLSTLLLQFTGMACQFDFFNNSNFAAVFLLFWSFGLAVLTFSFFLSTLTASVKSAQTVGYAIILIGFVFQTILCSAYGVLVDMLFSDDIAHWVVGVRYIMSFYPPFYLSKAFFDISVKSSSTINLTQGQIVQGPGFFWSDLYNTRVITGFFGLTINVPPTVDAILWLLLDAVVYGVLAWYLDNVLAGEHGSPRPWYFFVQPEYWGCRRARDSDRDVVSRLPRQSLAEGGDSDVEKEATRALGGGPHSVEGTGYGLCVQRLAKTYSASRIRATAADVKALDDVSFAVEDGEIFCILGPNGSGKSTMINVLTGLLTPTQGTAQVYGRSVTEDIDGVRKIMGLCPQHDVLWNELTAREHLRLFARLKSLDEAFVNQEIAQKLEMTSLTDVADHRVSTFSGGMKRRLSVAISAIGDPKIIYMDEPTTGMDPVNRRSVWTLIQSMKRDRVIILTTHSMEEADVLGDRIGMLVFGKMRCVGTSLRLKSRYGTGYCISLSTSPEQAPGVARALEKTLPGAKVVVSPSGAMTVAVPDPKSKEMTNVLEYLEDQSSYDTTVKGTGAVIKEWGVSHSSLEDVFIAVAKRHNFQYEQLSDDEEEPAAGTSAAAASHQHKPVLSRPKPGASNPYRALLRKNCSLQARQTGTNFCQIVTPMCVIGLLVLLQYIIRSELKGNYDIKELVPTLPWILNGNTSMSLPNSNESFPIPPAAELLQDTWRRIGKMDARAMTGRRAAQQLAREGPTWNQKKFVDHKSEHHLGALAESAPLKREGLRRPLAHSPPPPPPAGPPPPIPPANGTNYGGKTDGCLKFFWYSVPSSPSNAATEVGTLLKNGTGSGLLKHIIQTPCILANGTEVMTPFYVPRPSFEEMNQEAYDILGTFDSYSIQQVENPPVQDLLPDGYFSVDDISTENLTLSYTFVVNTNINIFYHRPNNFTRLIVHLVNATAATLLDSVFLIPLEGQLTLMDNLHQGFMQQVDKTPPLPYPLNWLDINFCQQMPYIASANLLVVLEAFGAFLYPVALTLQLPIYIYILVLEKATRLREMMKSMGMRMSSYVLTNVAFFFTLYSMVVIFFWIAGIIVQIRFFSQTHWSTLIVFFVGWGLDIIALAYFIAAFISSKEAATIIGYVVALLGTLIAILICVGVYGVFIFAVNPVLPHGYLVWPQFSMTRAIYLMNLACALEFSCYGPITDLQYSDELAPTLLSMYLAAVAYLILGLYLDVVLPQQWGIRKHPLFFLGLGREAVAKDANGGTERSPLLAETGNGLSRESPDVENERATATTHLRNGAPPAGFPCVALNVTKIYAAKDSKKPVPSLSNLCLDIPSGECFGLLGENGSGKTTTVSILTGFFPPTAGTAFVTGHSVITDVDRVHLGIGLCPQFNILWDALTVREHILFYARLKGIPSGEERLHADHLIAQFGLTKMADRLSCKLSGGMQRRLSVAISLVGHAAMGFLDEPTTGLDPVSRRRLWDLLQRAKKGRAMILTTHSMDEAELLCDRIGILAKGRMRCIGTQQHLKSNAGLGYRLTINYDPKEEPRVVAALATALPQATVLNAFAGARTYALPAAGTTVESFASVNQSTRVSAIFELLARQASGWGIKDWSLSQANLDEVFQKVVATSRVEQEINPQL